MLSVAFIVQKKGRIMKNYARSVSHGTWYSLNTPPMSSAESFVGKSPVGWCELGGSNIFVVGVCRQSSDIKYKFSSQQHTASPAELGRAPPSAPSFPFSCLCHRRSFSLGSGNGLRVSLRLPNAFPLPLALTEHLCDSDRSC